ncbi:nose resistant to fluoxetine protein 6-like [Glandiceps talaboti]
MISRTARKMLGRHFFLTKALTTITLLVAFTSVYVEALTPEAVGVLNSQNIGPVYATENSYNSTQKCVDGLMKLLLDETTKLLPALDATGKPASGFFSGNVVWLGAFEQCRAIDGMQYCLVDMKSTVRPNTSVTIRWGLCAVDECSEADVASVLQDLIQGILQIKWINVTESSVHCARDPPKPYNTGFYVMIAICAVLGFLMLFGWVVDIILNCAPSDPHPMIHKTKHARTFQDDASTEYTPLLRNTPDVAVVNVKGCTGHQCMNTDFLVELLFCFAVNKNLQKLLSTKQSEKAIGCLHGLRVISMSWVILGHTFLWPAITMLVDDWVQVLEMINTFSFQVLLNGTYSVDTFFVLSGLLVGYLVFFQLDKEDGQLPWFQYYFHRYWRLTPTMLFTILFWMYIRPWLGQGPVWYMTTYTAPCEKYWWTNILYINNFYPTNSMEGCIMWTWYLANDMQFYWISPILILAMYKSVSLGIISLSAVLGGSLMTTIALYAYFDFPSVMMAPGAGGVGAPAGLTPHGPNNFDIVYIKPYCRIAPYLTGLALGFLLQKRRHLTISLPYMVSIAGWLFSTVVAMAVIYGMYPSISNGHVQSNAEIILNGSFSRFAWSLSVGWVVFACRYNLAGPINDILSWDFWIPLSRLTYTAYLFHPIVLDVLVFNFMTPFHYTINIIAYLFVGVLFMTYGVSAIVFLAVEMPMANLEQLIRGRIEKLKKDK